MTLASIIREKGDSIYTISPNHTAKEAADRLVWHNIGALLVMDTSGPVGIISERDILRLCSRDPHAIESISVASIMTTNLIVSRLEDDVEDTLALMTNARIRHLPVLDGGRVVGLISLGDLVKSRLVEHEITITYLRDYITGTRI